MRHAMQIRREASERLHWLGISPNWNCDVMVGITNVNPCRIPVQRGQPLIPRSRALQHPLFLDALQATLQKIDLQRLLADLPFQLRKPAFRPALLPVTRKDVPRS